MSSYGQVYAAAIASVMETAVLQNAATGNGNGTSMTVAGYSTLVLGITASVAMSGGTSVNFEGTIDDTTWVPLLGTNVGTTVTATSATEPGDWVFSVVGYSKVRARISSYSAGTITVKGVVSALSSSGAGGGGGGSGNVNINQIAGNTPAVNNGAANNGTLRVSIASDSTGSVAASQSGSWSVTANAGSNLNTSALALESGGNLATVAGAVSSAKMQTNVSQINGVAPSMGNGSAGAGVQRVTIANDSTGTVAATQSGAWVVTANAGTNLNTSALALESGGNLATLAGAISSAKMQSNTAQINGVAPSMGNGISGTGVQRVTIASDSTGSLAATQSGTWNINNVSGTISLPTGAATAAKQPAIGTAGSPSGDVLTVQGTSSMTALKVDGSGSTQPISGTVTANAGTNLNTSALALESGGNLGTIAGAVSSAKMQINTAQINGVAPSMGNGASGTGVQRVTIANDSTGQIAQTASIVPTAVTMHNNSTGNGNGTSLNVQGYATALIDLSVSIPFGEVVVNFEASADDTNWFPVSGVLSGTGVTTVSALFTNYSGQPGEYLFDVSGFKSLRARISDVYGDVSVSAKGYVSVFAREQSTPVMSQMTIMQKDAVALGNGVPLYVRGCTNAMLELTGNMTNNFFAGIVEFQGLTDNLGTWVPISGLNIRNCEYANRITATGYGTSELGTETFVFNTIGFIALRAVITSRSDGYINVRGSALSGTNELVHSLLKVSNTARGTAGNLQVASSNGNGQTLNVAGLSTIGVNVTNDPFGTGTVSFEVSIDGSNWTSIAGLQLGATTTTIAKSIDLNAVSNTTWMFRVAGYMSFRARISNYGGGTITCSAFYTDIVEFKNAVEPIALMPSPGPAAVTLQNAAIGNVNGNSLDVQGYSSATLSITGAGASATVNFEASFDDTNWVPITGQKSQGGTSTFTSFTSASSMGDWQFNVVGLKSLRARISNLSAGSVTVKGYTSVLASDTPKRMSLQAAAIPTYTACNNQYTVPATPTEMITFYGSSSKVVKILRIEILTEQTTAGTNFIYVYRRTDVPSGGTSTSVTPFQHDTADASPSATMKFFTANPSLLTGSTKLLDGWNIQAPAAASNIQPNWKVIYSCSEQEKPIVLRGTLEGVGINFNGAALPSGFKIQARFTWTEE